MEKSKVYFTDFRARLGEGLPTKLKRLMKKAGFASMDMEGKFVAIKIHFGELGNISYLRPNYAKAVVDMVKEAGGIPFLTDCNTLYPGSRKNAIEHMYCAWENGFTPMTVGCPVIIGDGLKGTDDIAVPVKGGTYIKEAKIGRAIMDADIFISLTHFKGHETTGFGGMISFTTDTEETARRILERVKLIIFAESLGGVESLITYPMLQTHGDVPVETRERLGITETFLRLSVGIENCEDLIRDLDQAING